MASETSTYSRKLLPAFLDYELSFSSCDFPKRSGVRIRKHPFAYLALGKRARIFQLKSATKTEWKRTVENCVRTVCDEKTQSRGFKWAATAWLTFVARETDQIVDLMRELKRHVPISATSTAAETRINRGAKTPLTNSTGAWEKKMLAKKNDWTTHGLFSIYSARFEIGGRQNVQDIGLWYIGRNLVPFF